MSINRSKQGGKLYLVMMLVVIACNLLIAFIPQVPVNMTGVPGNIVFSEVLFLVPALVILVMDGFEPLRAMKLRPIGLPTILWTLLLSLLLLPVMSLMNLLTQYLVPNVVAGELYQASALPLWVSLIYFAVLPPLVEEFLFRGVLYQYFRPTGLWKTALITSLMFGLAHLNLNQFLYAFVIGVFWTMLDEATGSLFSSMLSHSVVNGLNVVLVYVARSNLPENLTGAVKQAEAQTPGLVALIILAVVAGACVILSVIVIRHLALIRGNEQKYKDARKGKDKVLHGKDARAFSVPLLLGLVIPVVFIGVNMMLQVRQ